MERVELSVLIPVWKSSPYLEKLLEALLEEKGRVNFEILVVVDEPDEDVLLLKKAYSREKRVRFFFNERRLGKVRALNDVAKKARGKFFLFLDSDVMPGSRRFILRTLEEIESRGVDILDFRKEVEKSKSFLSKMNYHEYVGFNAITYLMARMLGRSVGLGGCGFCVRKSVFRRLGGFREVIVEDMDFATRSYFEGVKFGYAESVSLKVYPLPNWGKWFSQKKRWFLGGVLWFLEWWKPILRETLKKPHAFLPPLILYFPSLPVFILVLSLPTDVLYKVVVLCMLTLSLKFPVILPALSMATVLVALLKGIFASLGSFLAVSLTFLPFYRKLGFRFSLPEFFAYYFFYSFLNFLVLLLAVPVGLLRRDGRYGRFLDDWKV